MTSPLVRTDSDIERIVLDRCSTEGEYLSLLADLPHSFAGDVLMIRTDSTGFLSATGRGGEWRQGAGSDGIRRQQRCRQ